MTGLPIIVRHHFRLFDPASWLSCLIRLIDKGWANHCGLLLIIDGDWYVVDARSSGIYLSTMANWEKHRPHKSYLIGHMAQKVTMPANMQSRILSRTGTEYDKIGLLFWHPFRLIFGKWKGGTSEDGKLVCSEFVGLCWKEYFPNSWMRLSTGDIERSGIFIF